MKPHAARSCLRDELCPVLMFYNCRSATMYGRTGPPEVHARVQLGKQVVLGHLRGFQIAHVVLVALAPVRVEAVLALRHHGRVPGVVLGGSAARRGG